jgi:hypothetical protein
VASPLRYAFAAPFRRLIDVPTAFLQRASDVVWLYAVRYEMEIINKGDIVCEFTISPPKTPFASMFTFTPDGGSLAVGASQRLAVTFCSSLLGEFAEVFDVIMKGSNERLRAQFKGHVTAPTFHMDAEELDYGKVAYEFLNTREFSLFNTSTVPFTYRFRVPQVREVSPVAVVAWLHSQLLRSNCAHARDSQRCILLMCRRV